MFRQNNETLYETNSLDKGAGESGSHRRRDAGYLSR